MNDYNNSNGSGMLYNTESVLDAVINKNLGKLEKKAKNAGYECIDTFNNKNGFGLLFGNLDKNEYYKLTISNLGYDCYGKQKISSGKIKGDIKLEKLLNFDEDTKNYENSEDIFAETGVGGALKKYNRKVIEVYNKNKGIEMPKLRNYNINKGMLYLFAAAYGATVLSAADNTSLANNAYYGFLHLGMLVAPYLPLQISRKTRSLTGLISLALVSWVANSISYYPIGMVMEHTADNIGNMLKWYKFQMGFGSGSYIDKYGPLSVTVSSKAKALSYAGRLGVAGMLSQFDKISDKVKKIGRFGKNGNGE